MCTLISSHMHSRHTSNTAVRELREARLQCERLSNDNEELKVAADESRAKVMVSGGTIYMSHDLLDTKQLSARRSIQPPRAAAHCIFCGTVSREHSVYRTARLTRVETVALD